MRCRGRQGCEHVPPEAWELSLEASPHAPRLPIPITVSILGVIHSRDARDEEKAGDAGTASAGALGRVAVGLTFPVMVVPPANDPEEHDAER